MIEGLVPNLVYDLFKSGANVLRNAGQGDEQERALKAAYEYAFGVMVNQGLSNLDKHIQDHVAEGLKNFIRDKDVSNRLLSIALEDAKPTIEDMQPFFERYEFDNTTIGLIDTFIDALEIELQQIAGDQNSPIYNLVSIYKQTQISHKQDQILSEVQNLKKVVSNSANCPPMPDLPQEFGGRDEDLKALMGALTSTNGNITLHGGSGIGKTTLVKKLSHVLVDDAQYRTVIWTEIGRLADIVQLLTGWARFGNHTYIAPKLPVHQIAQEAKMWLQKAIQECRDCENEQVLIVLDDVWEKTKDIARQLIQAKPDNSQVLIITRSEKTGRNFSKKIIQLNYMTETQSAQMLAEYLDNVEQSKLSDIGKALGGHPQAMKLAAMRARKEAGRPGVNLNQVLELHIAEYNDGIKSGTPFEKLKLERSDETDKEENLSVALSYSYDELENMDQTHFRALGILAYDTPFDISLLSRLWNVAPLIVEDYCDSLRMLALIENDPSGKVGWYRQHPLLRSYARVLLTEKKENQSIFDIYTDFVIEKAENFKFLPVQEWEILDPYLPHILQLGDDLMRNYNSSRHTSAARKLLDFVLSLFNYLFRKGIEQSQLEWITTALEACTQVAERETEGNLLNLLGSFYWGERDFHKAKGYCEKAWKIFDQLDNAKGKGEALNNLAEIEYSLGNLGMALDHHKEVMEYRKKANDFPGMGITFSNIGQIYSNSDYPTFDKELASRSYEASHKILSEVDDKWGDATTLYNWGCFLLNEGKLGDAQQQLLQSLELRQEIKDTNGIGFCYKVLGNLSHDLHKPQEALDYYTKAESLLIIFEEWAEIASIYFERGRIFDEIGNKISAIQHYSRALDICAKVYHPACEVVTSQAMSIIYLNQNELDKAIEYLERAIRVDKKIRILPDHVSDELKWLKSRRKN